MALGCTAALYCVLICCAALIRGSALVFPQHAEDYTDRQILGPSTEPQICVVVRTYWAHAGPTGLQKLIKSLQRQSFRRWEAVLLVLDGKPFEELAQIVQGFEDSRLWTYAEWIGVQYSPQGQHGWATGYHHQLYNLTDEAVRACPPTAQWVIVTNGDNEYADSLFETLLQTTPDKDLVALDYYSRYQRPTGPPCTRFSAEEGLPPCKNNKMQWCHTDLGANVLRWPRLIAENRRFGDLQDHSGGLTAEHFDGVMMMRLLEAGWKARHVEGTCLFEHTPSPQRCAREGGVWDESQMTPASPLGGACISQQHAQQLKLSHAAFVEELEVTLSSDGKLDAFEGGLAGNDTTKIRCLRKADADAQHQEYMRFFGPYCAAEADMEVFEAHLLAQNMDDVDEQRAHWASQQAHETVQPAARPLQPPRPPPKDAKVNPELKRRLPTRF